MLLLLYLLSLGFFLTLYHSDNSTKLRSFTGVTFPQLSEIAGKVAGELKDASTKLRPIDIVLLVFMRLKTYLTMELLGWIFGLHKATCSRLVNEALPRLHEFFSRYIRVPAVRSSFRGFVPKAFDSDIQVYAVAAVDGFERSVYVPSWKQLERRVYSGKKGYTTFTHLLMVTLDGRCCFISDAYDGCITDQQLIGFFENRQVLNEFVGSEAILFDAGFYGAQNYAVGCKASLLVSKKPSYVRSEKEREYEKLLKSYRIIVENYIAQIRQFNGLNVQLRVKGSLDDQKKIENLMVGVAIGIINSCWKKLRKKFKKI